MLFSEIGFYRSYHQYVENNQLSKSWVLVCYGAPLFKNSRFSILLAWDILFGGKKCQSRTPILFVDSIYISIMYVHLLRSFQDSKFLYVPSMVLSFIFSIPYSIPYPSLFSTLHLIILFQSLTPFHPYLQQRKRDIP